MLAITILVSLVLDGFDTVWGDDVGETQSELTGFEALTAMENF